MFLRSALTRNPWQTGDDKWAEIVEDIKDQFNAVVAVQTLRDRLKLLLKKYKSQELKITSGNEEETTERGFLLESINAIQEEQNAAKNLRSSTAKQRIEERVKADAERDQYFDEANKTALTRKRLSPEEQLIKERQQHNMQIHKSELDLEKQRLEIDKLRQSRKEEEGREMIEIKKMKFEAQSKMLQMMQNVLE